NVPAGVVGPLASRLLRKSEMSGLSEVIRRPPASTVKTARLITPEPLGFCTNNVSLSPTVAPLLAITSGMSHRLSRQEMAVSVPPGVEKPKPCGVVVPKPPMLVTSPPNVVELTLKMFKPGTTPPMDAGVVIADDNAAGQRKRSACGN